MTDRVKNALAMVQRWQNELAVYCEQDYPPGATIRWEWNAGVYVGHVIRHGYGSRLYVRNDVTNKARWIHAYNIVVVSR